ncbi:MAG: hypothetical protein KQ78_02006 [Candidatus Izimaplasma bacterium HR2]|nr:MAG: hypothetical protein KQ78_02006 [Candidatus Izimaplasma bacterium HR2]
MNIYNCYICGKSFDYLGGISRHIKRVHNITRENYYIQFIGNKGKCEVCSNNTRFLDIEKGYKRFCSHKCANAVNNPTIIRDSILNRTDERKTELRKKIQKTWKNKSETEKSEHIRKIKESMDYDNISKKRSKTMLKWNATKKQDYIKKLKKSWQIKSDEELNEKYRKQKETNISNGNWIPDKIKDEFYAYKLNVRQETRKWIKLLFSEWTGLDYYTKEKLITTEEFVTLYDKHPNSNKLQPTIDHMISIHEGFLDNIDYKIIGNIKNLCVCSRKNNSKKRNENIKNFLEKIRDC